MKMTLLGCFVTVALSVTQMVDVPVKANDPKAKERMILQPVKTKVAARDGEVALGGIARNAAVKPPVTKLAEQ